MVTHSKQDLINQLAKGDALHGWGAIIALGRDALNRRLLTRYVEGFAAQTFIPPISGEGFLDANLSEKFVFDQLLLGPLQLSFKHASGSTRELTVTLELIAGRCSSIAQWPGEPKRLRRSHSLHQGMGYRLEVTLPLTLQTMSFANQTQVVLDLQQASAACCTLGSTEVAQRKMGEFLLDQVRTQWGRDPLVPLLSCSHEGSDPLSIAQYSIQVQKAPTDIGNGGAREDDGALLILAQLRGSPTAGVAPHALPYLLPDKDDGSGHHDAALLLGRRRSSLVEGLDAGILEHVILPGAYQIAPTERHSPHDLILFADVVPSEATAELQPALKGLSAGQSLNLQSTLHAVGQWSARNVTYPLAHGQMDQGRYTASALQDFTGDQQVVVISAESTEGGTRKVRSAVVVEAVEGVSISPKVLLWNRGEAPVRLTASSAEGVAWSLQGTRFGELQRDPDDPQSALFTPSVRDAAAPFELQRIKVSKGSESGYATVVILNYSSPLSVEPFHVPRIGASGTQTFSLSEYPGQATWQLVGTGHIDANTGVYTAPSSDPGDVTVVIGVYDRFAGIAVIEHQNNPPAQIAAAQERWKELNLFDVKRNNANRNRVLANGLQQVGIDIVLETKEFEGAEGSVWDPVSDLELSTLVLLYEDGTPVPVLPVGVEGLDPDLPANRDSWAVSKQRNRYDYLPTGSGAPPFESSVAPADARRTVTFYVCSTEAEVRRFKAKFQDQRNGWHYSDIKDQGRGVLELEGVPTPAVDLGNYALQAKRVESLKGFDHTNGDTFNYWHSTTDYWTLYGRQIVFAGIEWDNSAMIRWESENKNETYCSYTGYAFKPRRHPDAAPASREMQYGASLELLLLEDRVKSNGLDRRFKGQESVAEGTVLLSLERTSNLSHWQYQDGDGDNYRLELDKALSFTLIDTYGSRHRLKVTFGNVPDSRNSLTLNLQ
nr:hypothetical protein [Pseudomonas cremoricolorata]